MKSKLAMFAAIAVGGLMTVGATEGALQSQNIVGYVKRSSDVAVNAFTMVTMPFSTVGSDVVSIQDVIIPEGVEACSDMESKTKGAQLQVWTGSSYKPYYYINDGFNDDYEDLTGWANAGEIVEDVYAPGTGFWYRYPVSRSNYTLPGQVLDADTVSKNVYNSKFNMIGNPYPTLLDFTKVTTTVPAVTDSESKTKGVQLQVWTGTTYQPYYYISDGFTDEEDDVTGWANAGEVKYKVGTDATFALWVMCLDKNATADANGKVGVITFAK